MEKKFNVGDLVHHISNKTSHILMTVRGYTKELEKKADPISAKFRANLEKISEELVTCDWRDPDGVPHNNDFNENELVKC